MGIQRPKKVHKADKSARKIYRTKRRTKDLDIVHAEIQPDRLETTLVREVDGDLPGLGQIYCVHCVRHFINPLALREHLKSKVHKRRVKQLSMTPYTLEEAERAAGVGNYYPPQHTPVPNVSVGANEDGAVADEDILAAAEVAVAEKAAAEAAESAAAAAAAVTAAETAAQVYI